MAERPLRWVITGYKHAWYEDDLYIKVRVDPPTKLYIHWTNIPPRVHPVAEKVRGMDRKHWPRYCFVEFVSVDNIECTDVPESSFIIPNWRVGERRWWLFSGTRGGAVTKSVSGIFSAVAFGADEAEKPDLPGEKKLVHREEWTGPVTSRPSHIYDHWDFQSGAWCLRNLPGRVISPPTHFWHDLEVSPTIWALHKAHLPSGAIVNHVFYRVGVPFVVAYIPFRASVPPLGAELSSFYGAFFYAGYEEFDPPRDFFGLLTIAKVDGGMSELLGFRHRYYEGASSGVIRIEVTWRLRDLGLVIDAVVRFPGFFPLSLSVMDSAPWFADRPSLRAGFISAGFPGYSEGSFDDTEVYFITGDWPPPCP